MNDITGSLSQLLRQHERLLKLHFPHDDGPDTPLLINTMTALESVSRDFRVSLELLCDDARLELKSLMGKLVTVELELADGSPRYFNGYVFEFRFLHADAGYAFYHMEIGPWTRFLALRHDNYIFHDQTLQEALNAIFADYHPMADVSWKLQNPPQPETMRVQWDESDHNYLHRRLEEKGWYYWFEHRDNGHTLVISDDSTLAPSIDGDPTVRYHGEHAAEEADSITALMPIRKIVPGTVALSAFDFKKPRPMQASVDTINEQGDIRQIEHYEYAGAYGYANQRAGDKLVRLRMEEFEADGKCFEGKGNCRTLQSGRVVEISDHFDLDKGEAKDRQFLILSVEHTATNNYLERGSQTVYRNRFTAIRKHIPFRPKRGFNSYQPLVHGLQTALVVGPPGEEIYTDQYGRIRVQYHWDREGKNNGSSSCWVRVASPWAGSNFGAISIPRCGQEIVLQHLGGNPDHPLVIASVYNDHNMPPWTLPDNKTQSGILTRSSTGGTPANANALRFEDKKGLEEIWLHAEKDQRIEVENDESHTVGHNRTKTIGNDETVHVKHDRTETVDNNETITVHNNRQERVDNNETISVGANRTEDVGGNETLDVKGNRSETIHGFQTLTIMLAANEAVALAKALEVGAGYAVTVGGAMNVTVGLASAEEVGLNKTVAVGGSYNIKVVKQYQLDVGKSHISADSDGNIIIKGASIDIEATGQVKINGKDVDINP